jgi:hypothetical protein
MMFRRLSAICVAVALVGASTGAALADKIANPIAVFSGLDKITGRIVSFEAAIDETVQFGALQITPRVCYTRPATETPNTTAFVEVDEITASNEVNRIFAGWMFAASPGLSGIEHPVYDVWLTDCKGGTQVIVEPKDRTGEEPPPPNAQPLNVPRSSVPQPRRQVLPPSDAPRQRQPQPMAPAEPPGLVPPMPIGPDPAR